MVFRKGYIVIIPVLILHSLLISGQNDYQLYRLPINTKSKELAPAFCGRNLVFCSDRKNDVLITYTDQNDNPLTNLYLTDIKKSGMFGKPRLMSRELTSFLFEGPSAFSKDGNTMFFTRTIDIATSARKRNRPDTTFGIFTSKLVNGNWSTPAQMGFNSSAYNTGYPCVSEDGRELFFCSDAPGGYGGLDIYVSSFVNGSWSKPENLGPGINTSKNEVFPFLHHSGRLYFASRGLNQRGDMDIYYTVNVDGTWQKPVSLPEPFNSAQDDFGLIFNATADTGYFSSNRDGSDDIFAVYSVLPSFTDCTAQKENDYCYVFYESNNNELDTTAFAFEWDLGDGSKVRSLEAEHCFAQPGTYLVQLNIIDKLTKDVLISQATYTFTVEKIEQPYIQCSDTVFAGSQISLNGRETFLKDFTISNYYWDFGDGSVAQGVDSKHTFLHPGTYNVRLGVTGQKTSTSETGLKKCSTRQIVVMNTKK